MLSTLSRLSEGVDRGVPSWLSTHPEASDRVIRIEPTIKEIATEQDLRALRVNRDPYLDRLDGLLFGDNPDQGVVRGRDFLHPVLRFVLRFPDAWNVGNTPTQVAAQHPDGEVFMVLQVVANPAAGDLETLAVDNMRESGFSFETGRATSINALEAYEGTFLGEMDQAANTEPPTARVAFIDYDDSIYLVGGVAPAQEYDQVEEDFKETILSFRPLSAAEAEDIRPNRIQLYTVRSRDTWGSIAERAGQGIVPATTLAIMNSVSADEQPRAGDRIKIVVEG